MKRSALRLPAALTDRLRPETDRARGDLLPGGERGRCEGGSPGLKRVHRRGGRLSLSAHVRRRVGRLRRLQRRGRVLRAGRPFPVPVVGRARRAPRGCVSRFCNQNRVRQSGGERAAADCENQQSEEGGHRQQDQKQPEVHRFRHALYQCRCARSAHVRVLIFRTRQTTDVRKRMARKVRHSLHFATPDWNLLHY